MRRAIPPHCTLGCAYLQQCQTDGQQGSDTNRSGFVSFFLFIHYRVPTALSAGPWTCPASNGLACNNHTRYKWTDSILFITSSGNSHVFVWPHLLKAATVPLQMHSLLSARAACSGQIHFEGLTIEQFGFWSPFLKLVNSALPVTARERSNSQ